MCSVNTGVWEMEGAPSGLLQGEGRQGGSRAKPCVRDPPLQASSFSWKKAEVGNCQKEGPRAG